MLTLTATMTTQKNRTDGAEFRPVLVFEPLEWTTYGSSITVLQYASGGSNRVKFQIYGSVPADIETGSKIEITGTTHGILDGEWTVYETGAGWIWLVEPQWDKVGNPSNLGTAKPFTRAANKTGQKRYLSTEVVDFVGSSFTINYFSDGGSDRVEAHIYGAVPSDVFAGATVDITGTDDGILDGRWTVYSVGASVFTLVEPSWAEVGNPNSGTVTCAPIHLTTEDGLITVDNVDESISRYADTSVEVYQTTENKRDVQFGSKVRVVLAPKIGDISDGVTLIYGIVSDPIEISGGIIRFDVVSMALAYDLPITRKLDDAEDYQKDLEPYEYFEGPSDKVYVNVESLGFNALANGDTVSVSGTTDGIFDGIFTVNVISLTAPSTIHLIGLLWSDNPTDPASKGRILPYKIEYPDALASEIGKTKPVVYDYGINKIATVVEIGGIGYLSSSMDDTSTASFYLDSGASSFPSSGEIMIGSERISYSGKTGSQLTGIVRNIRAVDSLSTGISDTETTSMVLLTSTEYFPDSGVVSIGTENIAYASKTSTSLDALTRGVDSTTPSSHSSSAIVSCLTGFAHSDGATVIQVEVDRKFIVADHEIHSITSVGNSSSNSLTESTYWTKDLDLAMIIIDDTQQMSWVDSGYGIPSSIYVSFRGHLDDGAGTITGTPYETISYSQHIARHALKTYGFVHDEEISTDDFDISELTNMAFHINESKTVLQLLSDIEDQTASIIAYTGGRWIMRRRWGDGLTSQRTLYDADIVRTEDGTSTLIQSLNGWSGMTNKISWAADDRIISGGNQKGTAHNYDSQRKYGIVEQNFNFLNVYSVNPSLSAIPQWKVDKYGRPNRKTISFSTTLKHIDLELGDVITIYSTVNQVYVTGEITSVLRYSSGDNFGTIKFTIEEL